MLSADGTVVLFVLDIDVAPALHVARVAVVPDILALDDAVRFLVVDGHALVALGVTRLVVEGDVVAVDVSFWRCDSGMAHRPCRTRYLVEEALVGMDHAAVAHAQRRFSHHVDLARLHVACCRWCVDRPDASLCGPHHHVAHEAEVLGLGVVVALVGDDGIGTSHDGAPAVEELCLVRHQVVVEAVAAQQSSRLAHHHMPACP